MSNQRPVTAADLKHLEPLGMPLLKLLGFIVLATAITTIAYELLF